MRTGFESLILSLETDLLSNSPFFLSFMMKVSSSWRSKLPSLCKLVFVEFVCSSSLFTKYEGFIMKPMMLISVFVAQAAAGSICFISQID